MYTVVCRVWEESERGWGERPDGYSLHLSEEDLGAFVWAYNDTLPATPPDSYSRPTMFGHPYLCHVDDATYAEVRAGRHGIRKEGPPPAPLES